MESFLGAIGSPITIYRLAVLTQNFEETPWTLSARRYLYKRLAVLMKFFLGLSGLCRLAVLSITVRRYHALIEQSFVFLLILVFLSLSLSLQPATAPVLSSQIHHFSCLFFTKLKDYKSFSSSLASFNRLKFFFFFKI